MLHELGLNQTIHLPLVFYSKHNFALHLIAIKIVSDVLISGEIQEIKNEISQIKRKYKFGNALEIFYSSDSIQYKNLI